MEEEECKITADNLSIDDYILIGAKEDGSKSNKHYVWRIGEFCDIVVKVSFMIYAKVIFV